MDEMINKLNNSISELNEKLIYKEENRIKLEAKLNQQDADYKNNIVLINIFQEDLKAEIANLQIDNQKLKVDIV